MSARKSLYDFPQSSYIAFPLLTSLGYLFSIPILVALSAPSGIAAKFLTPLLAVALRKVSHGATTLEDSPQKAIVLLTGFYVVLVHIFSGIMSATGQLLGNETGYKNKEPRANKRGISTGLPHRMIATHEALYDIFPAYAVTAALVAVSLTSKSSTVPINGLVLHVFFKIVVYSPAYLFDADIVRSYSHLCSILALLLPCGVLWQSSSL